VRVRAEPQNRQADVDSAAETVLVLEALLDAIEHPGALHPGLTSLVAKSARSLLGRAEVAEVPVTSSADSALAVPVDARAQDKSALLAALAASELGHRSLASGLNSEQR
jgi:hypothetical protein